jgi:hypothetical protein
MSLKVTRSISQAVERELWGRAAGRCEFNGCNKALYKSSVTQEQGNFSEKAHIYSFSEDGPRGRDNTKAEGDYLNKNDNLLLVCDECHKTIDQNKGIGYPVELLQGWKKEHEDRIAIVSGIESNKKSHVVFYEAKIGTLPTKLNKIEAMKAIFPNRYPATENPIILSMSCSHEDIDAGFWSTESAHLRKAFKERIISLIEATSDVHFSLFSLAPIPLLIELGTLLTDKINVDVYQPIREPKGWKWQEFPEGFEYVVKQPESYDGQPTLVISLSDKIPYIRVKEVVGENASIWELTVSDAFIGNDNIRSLVQLSMMRSSIRELMTQIKDKHGADTPLNIFPAMAVSVSVEMGRSRMPKADMPWIIYDFNNKLEQFIKALIIGGNND